MNKIYKVFSLLVLMFSVTCYSMPFLKFNDYNSLTGIDLIKNIFKQIELQRITQGPQSDVFSSTSVPLAVTLVFLLITLGIMIVAILTSNSRALTAAIITISGAIISYGLQLANSETSFSDFFGTMLKAEKAGNGSTIFKPSDIVAQTGLGARLLIILCFISLILILLVKVLDNNEKNKASKIQTPLAVAIKQFRRNKLAISGLIIIIFLVIAFFTDRVFLIILF